MTRSVVDQIPFLSNEIEGLIKRLHYFVSLLKDPHQKSSSTTKLLLPVLQLTSVEMDKLCKLFQKSFPDTPSNFNKMPVYEELKQAATGICKQLRDFYLTLYEIEQLKHTTMSVLKSVFSDLNELQFQMHPEFFSQIFSLFCNYIRMHMYWSDIREVKFFISIFSTCCKLAENSSFEEDRAKYVQLAEYVKDFHETPIAKIQDEFHSTSHHIIKMLLTCREAYNNYKDTSTLRNSDSFSIEVLRSGSFADAKLHEEMVYGSSIIDWVIWGVIICPSQLKRKDVVELYELVGEDSFIIKIFLDKVINFHDLLADNISTKTDLTANIDSNTKKQIRRVAKTSAARSGNYHRDRRIYVRWALNNLVSLLADDSALAAPLLVMIISEIYIAKDEILWYMYHKSCNFPKNISQKYYKKDLYYANDIPELIYLLNNIHQLCMSEQSNIKEFFSEFLVKSHAPNILISVNEITNNSPECNPRVIALLRSLPLILKENVQGDSSEISLINFRRDWTRTVMSILSMKQDVDRELFNELNSAYIHSFYVNLLHGELNKAFSLEQMYWFQDVLRDVMLSLTNNDASYQFSSILNVIDHFSYNIHHSCPEEQSAIDNAATACLEDFIAILGDQLDSIINGIFDEYYKLNMQIHSVEAAKRFKRQQESRNMAQMMKETIPKPPEFVPGLESKPGNESKIQMLLNFTKKIIYMGNCVLNSSFDGIIIHNSVFDTKCFFENKMKDYFGKFLLQIIKDRPSIMLEKINLFTWITVQISKLCGLSLEVSIYQVLLKECHFIAAWNQRKSQPILNSGHDSFLLKYRNWLFESILDLHSAYDISNLQYRSIYFSSFRNSCIRKDLSSKKKIDSEAYTTSHELQSLVNVIGPHGVYFLHASLNKMLVDVATSMKECLQADKLLYSQLSTLIDTFQHNDDCYKAINSIQSLEKFAILSVYFGNIIFIQRLLSSALNKSMRAFNPLLHKTIQLAKLSSPIDTERKIAVDCYAADLGYCEGDMKTSPYLVNELLKLKQGAEDEALWDLLPYAFAACFEASVWKNAQYISAIDCFSNNAQNMALTINTLLYTFEPMVTTGGKTGKVSYDLSQSLESYVRTSAAIILQQGKLNPAALLFMDKFAEEATEFDRGCMETVLPYSLIHSSYIHSVTNEKGYHGEILGTI